MKKEISIIYRLHIVNNQTDKVTIIDECNEFGLAFTCLHEEKVVIVSKHMNHEYKGDKVIACFTNHSVELVFRRSIFVPIEEEIVITSLYKV